jgi:translation initiation factor 3 subunit C
MKEEEVEDEPIQPVQKREIVSQTTVQDNDEGFSAVGKGGKAIVSVTSENLLTRLREVLESRGKKVKVQYRYHIKTRI